jgi:abequosyltransferase
MPAAPRLSLCMPTYNRAAYIGATLESILPQLTDDVEVVVVDGASPDETGAIVSSFAAREPRIRYERLAAKGGVDRDIDHAVALGHGEYCWIFPDDDLLKPGAIARVLRHTREGHDLIVVNAEVKGPDLRDRLQARFIDIADDRVYESGDRERLFLDTANYLSYVGGVVIRKDVWMSRDRASYFGSDFVHVGVIFQRELPGTALLIAEPQIDIRYGNASWGARTFEIWTFKWPHMVWSFGGIADAIKARVCPRNGWCNLRRLLLQRALGVFSVGEYDRWIRRIDGPLPLKLCARVIAALPGAPLNLLAVLHATIRRQGATLFDLRRSRFYPFRSVSRT